MNPTRLTLVLLALIVISSCTNREQPVTAGKNPVTVDSIENSGQKIAADSSTSDSLREQLIEHFATNNQPGKALEQVEILLKKNPSNPAWLYMKADAHEKMGDTSAAITAYEQAIDAAGLFVDAEIKLANLLAETGNAKAIVYCEKLLKEPSGIRMRSDILLIKGIYYTKIKNLQQALLIFNQLIKEDYSYLDAYVEKGLILYDEKKYKEAFAVFQMTTTIKNSFADGYFWMAKAEEKMKLNESAINNYKRTLALDQSFTEAREGLKRLGALK